MINKVYLSGGMSDLSMSEQMEWRDWFENKIHTESGYFIKVFSPPKHFNFEESNHISETEVFNYDLRMLKTSDLVIVNFNNPKSLGTAMELAIAKEFYIPVVGLNTENHELHPWLTECCERIFNDKNDLFTYLVKHYFSVDV